VRRQQVAELYHAPDPLTFSLAGGPGEQRHPLQRTAGQAQTRAAGFLAQASD
jgi:hypothetical protein